MLCIKSTTRLHGRYGLWIMWVIFHAPSIQSLSQTIGIFRTDLSHFSREKLWNFQPFCQSSFPNFVRRLYPKLDDTLKSMRQIRDVITSSVSFTFRVIVFAADNKASLPFQSLSNIFILLVVFTVFLCNRNHSWMISADWLNTFRIFFHANRSLVHWALRMPVWMNILLVMTKREEPCIGFLKMLNKSKPLYCR